MNPLRNIALRLKRSPRRAIYLPTLHAASAVRTVRANGLAPARVFAALDDAPIFVVGSPRSGTSFTAGALGQVPGIVDLGEFNPLKREVADLLAMPREQAATRLRRTVRIGQRLGLLGGQVAVEQTPESTYLIPIIAAAFPKARFLHLVRDGRDVVCSLLVQRWLEDDAPAAHDDAGNATGATARFWVEPERRDEFSTVSPARRAAWAWRRYETAAQAGLRGVDESRVLRVPYEELVSDPTSMATRIASFLGRDDALDSFVSALGEAHPRSVGRWREHLDVAQLADVEAEAGDLLAELGYEPLGVS